MSCQAREGSPLLGPSFMAAMARSAASAGAGGVRVDGPTDIEAVHAVVTLPIIGIYKRRDLDPDVYITPTLSDVQAVLRAGADIVAIDGTFRPQPNGLNVREYVGTIRQRVPGLPIMVDVSTFDEGVAAAEAGADLVATTLSGYTSYSPQCEDPDIALIGRLSEAGVGPVVAEGRFWHPPQVREAFEAGAFAVVVGTAITNPSAIAERFVRACPRRPAPARGM